MYSTFDLFKIGVGPSSSHTVGPMLAAHSFAALIANLSTADSGPNANREAHRVQVTLYGSLALTGLGHATDVAVIGGLSGLHPRTVETEELTQTVAQVCANRKLQLFGQRAVEFDPEVDIEFRRSEFLDYHPNGIVFQAFDESDSLTLEKTYYSIGGGFIVDHESVSSSHSPLSLSEERSVRLPFPFTNAESLLRQCETQQLRLAELVHRNELAWRTETEISEGLDEIWGVMESCIERGCRTTGELPGGLRVKRRAADILHRLENEQSQDNLQTMDWVSLFALAVNEENAAGGKVVTAPTNGAAGVIPAVLMYFMRFGRDASIEKRREFLKVAGAIGALYKMNASLSAAEMGCQGEVGVASSMAAAGLASVMGGTNSQIENAAEIAMEHHLGLTCDPIRGLVQVPCIERNTMGAVKAINAARLAVLYGDGRHQVSLDKVIETMRQTGHDMQSKYKETSLGGLAVNVTEC